MPVRKRFRLDDSDSEAEQMCLHQLAASLNDGQVSQHAAHLVPSRDSALERSRGDSSVCAAAVSRGPGLSQAQVLAASRHTLAGGLASGMQATAAPGAATTEVTAADGKPPAAVGGGADDAVNFINGSDHEPAAVQLTIPQMFQAAQARKRQQTTAQASTSKTVVAQSSTTVRSTLSAAADACDAAAAARSLGLLAAAAAAAEAAASEAGARCRTAVVSSEAARVGLLQAHANVLVASPSAVPAAPTVTAALSAAGSVAAIAMTSMAAKKMSEQESTHAAAIPGDVSVAAAADTMPTAPLATPAAQQPTRRPACLVQHLEQLELGKDGTRIGWRRAAVQSWTMDRVMQVASSHLVPSQRHAVIALAAHPSEDCIASVTGEDCITGVTGRLLIHRWRDIQDAAHKQRACTSMQPGQEDDDLGAESGFACPALHATRCEGAHVAAQAFPIPIDFAARGRVGRGAPPLLNPQAVAWHPRQALALAVVGADSTDVMQLQLDQTGQPTGCTRHQLAGQHASSTTGAGLHHATFFPGASTGLSYGLAVAARSGKTIHILDLRAKAASTAQVVLPHQWCLSGAPTVSADGQVLLAVTHANQLVLWDVRKTSSSTAQSVHSLGARGPFQHSVLSCRPLTALLTSSLEHLLSDSILTATPLLASHLPTVSAAPRPNSVAPSAPSQRALLNARAFSTYGNAAMTEAVHLNGHRVDWIGVDPGCSTRLAVLLSNCGAAMYDLVSGCITHRTPGPLEACGHPAPALMATNAADPAHDGVFQCSVAYKAWETQRLPRHRTAAWVPGRMVNSSGSMLACPGAITQLLYDESRTACPTLGAELAVRFPYYCGAASDIGRGMGGGRHDGLIPAAVRSLMWRMQPSISLHALASSHNRSHLHSSSVSTSAFCSPGAAVSDTHGTAVRCHQAPHHGPLKLSSVVQCELQESERGGSDGSVAWWGAVVEQDLVKEQTCAPRGVRTSGWVTTVAAHPTSGEVVAGSVDGQLLYLRAGGA